MALIEWDPSFSVGVVDIDQDHRRLVAILNRIFDTWQSHAATSESLNALFDELVAYTWEHFRREEEKMEGVHYPHFATHRIEHEKLRQQVMEFRASHISGSRPERLTEEMTHFLKGWLIDHILDADMKYRPFLKRG